MNYLKYTGLFFAIFFVLSSVGVAVVGGSDIVVVITLVITSVIIADMIIKSNNRVMTSSEIVKYTLCFSIATVMVAMVLFATLLSENYGLSHYFATSHLFIGVVIVVIIVLLPVSISMFLVNKYFKNKYKNGYINTPVLQKKY
ncbi:MAG: hypothetical protein LBG67_01860 [Campylobacteraceae bacterium]|jgi:hypothetical protein|nr:hypothetical protein [Campylobacteraceae bacterium]